MSNIFHYNHSTSMLVGAFIGLACVVPLSAAQAYTDPSTTQSFGSVTSGMKQLQYYSFGTASGRKIQNLSELDAVFNPYGIAGAVPINSEWERYQKFNSTNFVFTSTTLNLTATIPSKGGLYNGGINSGQMWTQQTFKPAYTGYNVYAFEVSMKIPGTVGMWPAAWFYSAPGSHDTSEVDLVEFMDMKNQDSHDWTGYDHGPGLGSDIFSRKTNKWVWGPGYDFSAAFHSYQLVWTPDATYRYVDGLLIYAQHFKWTGQTGAQFGMNLAVGSSEAAAPGLKPTSLSQFPAKLQIDHMAIWAK